MERLFYQRTIVIFQSIERLQEDRQTMSTIDIDYTIEHTIGLSKDYVTSKHYKKGKYLKLSSNISKND